MATPIDPYANAGAEGNIDRQKALLNDIIATQGQAGRQIYERQAPEAQAALQQQLASAPATPQARQDVFGAYVQDAKLAEQGQAEFMQRQNLLNTNFMEQAKAAVPIHAADVKNQQEALRMQFEAQAAARGGGGGGSRSLSVEERIAAGLDTAKVNEGIKTALLADIPKSQWTVSDAEKSGQSKSKASYLDAASELGLPPGFGIGFNSSQKSQVSDLQAWIDSLAKKDASFDEVLSQIQAASDEGIYSPDITRVVLHANARRWGITDPADWGQRSGQTYRA
jgi:hypothetical protein